MIRKFFNWCWPWPSRIRALESLNEDLIDQLLESEEQHVKDVAMIMELSKEISKLSDHNAQARRAMATMGIFIKRRHGLNLSEERMHQFIKP